MRLRRGFDLDPSTKLWLPLYQYGAEQTKIWDQSGNNNHGVITGAVPATYPLLSGVELVSNGGMETGNPPTGWLLYATETQASDAVVYHGGAKSCKVTLNAAGTTGGPWKVITGLTVGKKYKVAAWFRGVDIAVGTFNVLFSDLNLSIAVSNGSWTYLEGTTIATATSHEIYCINGGSTIANANKIFNVDDIFIQEITGYESIGWGFDGVDDRIVHPSLNLGTVHSLNYWTSKYPGNIGVVHGGAINYHGFRLTDTIAGYNVGTTEVTVNHGLTWTQLQQNKNLFSVIRNGTAVYFYLNGTQIGATQNLLANNNLTVTDVGRYSTPGSYYQGTIFDIPVFNRAFSAQEIRNYYELTRSRYGI
jgi:hypothetical protein